MPFHLGNSCWVDMEHCVAREVDHQVSIIINVVHLPNHSNELKSTIV